MKALIVSALLSATAQTAAAPDLDSVRAALGDHWTAFENDEVGVLRVDIGPGETEAIHEYCWTSVIQIRSTQPAVDISYKWRNGKIAATNRRQ